jgi:hypothetical protein
MSGQWYRQRNVLVLAALALVVVVVILAVLVFGDPPTFKERVDDAETCAELDEVAADARDPGGINEEAILDSVDDPDSPRAKELNDGIVDALIVTIRSNELNR